MILANQSDKIGGALKTTQLPGKRTAVRRRGPASRLIGKCDVLFSKLVRARDGACQAQVASTCSGIQRLQCAHLIPRGYKLTRWNFANAVTLCMSCHAYFTVRPLEWEAWIVAQLGAEEWDGLKKLALRYEKPDVEATWEMLQAMAKEQGLA